MAELHPKLEGLLHGKLLRLLQNEEWAQAVALLNSELAHRQLPAGVCDSEGRTALHLLYADESNEDETYPLLRLLLERGCEIDAEDEWGRTPLLWAAYSGAEARRGLHELIRFGAEASVVDGTGASAADLAWDCATKAVPRQAVGLLSSSFVLAWDDATPVELDEWETCYKLLCAGSPLSAASRSGMARAPGFPPWGTVDDFFAAKKPRAREVSPRASPSAAAAGGRLPIMAGSTSPLNLATPPLQTFIVPGPPPQMAAASRRQRRDSEATVDSDETLTDDSDDERERSLLGLSNSRAQAGGAAGPGTREARAHSSELVLPGAQLLQPKVDSVSATQHHPAGSSLLLSKPMSPQSSEAALGGHALSPTNAVANAAHSRSPSPTRLGLGGIVLESSTGAAGEAEAGEGQGGEDDFGDDDFGDDDFEFDDFEADGAAFEEAHQREEELQYVQEGDDGELDLSGLSPEEREELAMLQAAEAAELEELAHQQQQSEWLDAEQAAVAPEHNPPQDAGQEQQEEEEREELATKEQVDSVVRRQRLDSDVAKQQAEQAQEQRAQKQQQETRAREAATAKLKLLEEQATAQRERTAQMLQKQQQKRASPKVDSVSATEHHPAGSSLLPKPVSAPSTPQPQPEPQPSSELTEEEQTLAAQHQRLHRFSDNGSPGGKASPALAKSVVTHEKAVSPTSAAADATAAAGGGDATPPPLRPGEGTVEEQMAQMRHKLLVTQSVIAAEEQEREQRRQARLAAERQQEDERILALQREWDEKHLIFDPDDQPPVPDEDEEHGLEEEEEEAQKEVHADENEEPRQQPATGSVLRTAKGKQKRAANSPRPRKQTAKASPKQQTPTPPPTPPPTPASQGGAGAGNSRAAKAVESTSAGVKQQQLQRQRRKQQMQQSALLEQFLLSAERSPSLRHVCAKLDGALSSASQGKLSMAKLKLTPRTLALLLVGLVSLLLLLRLWARPIITACGLLLPMWKARHAIRSAQSEERCGYWSVYFFVFRLLQFDGVDSLLSWIPGYYAAQWALLWWLAARPSARQALFDTLLSPALALTDRVLVRPYLQAAPVAESLTQDLQ